VRSPVSQPPCQVYTMRADYNTTVTLYDGPGTATPGFPRVVDMPCRLVSDIYFADTDAPLDESLSYFTCDASAPRASVNTPLAAGKWEFDFTKADRAEFALFPGVLFVVVRVELCTWPTPLPTYYRGSLAEVELPPEECAVGYQEEYYVTDDDDMTTHTLTRTSSTTWEGDGYYLQAELTAATPPGCESTWRLTHEPCVQDFPYTGAGETVLPTSDVCAHTHTVSSTPP